VELTAAADRDGADALLVVTPYYIKPSQRGLVEYFVEVGKASGLPLLIYHIPGRAAVSIAVDTVTRIADRVPTLAGMKHAVNDLEFVSDVLERCGHDFRVFCGLEALSFPMLAVGAAGTMNALANLAPEPVAALCDAVARGDLAAARSRHDDLFALNQAIFYDTNPIPLKYMMWRLGLLESPELRLPLVPLADDQRARCDEVLRRAGLLAADATSSGTGVLTAAAPPVGRHPHETQR
jgi:4-hydroxy-tetrahydrodipicolinate synthase